MKDDKASVGQKIDDGSKQDPESLGKSDEQKTKKNFDIKKFPSKKSITDFLLLKHKTNELFYESSRLGPGRPGWHRECSTMSLSIHPNIEIHSGGIDLAFPHHDNEIEQSQGKIDKI